MSKHVDTLHMHCCIWCKYEIRKQGLGKWKAFFGLHLIDEKRNLPFPQPLPEHSFKLESQKAFHKMGLFALTHQNPTYRDC